MKKYYLRIQIYSLLLSLIFVTSCNGQVKTNLPKDNVSEPKTIANGQPKLVKTQGTGPGANVHCGLQDKAGNLWFGTMGEGIYRYDGKSFTNFTVKDGLIDNNVGSILEDKTGKIWFGTDVGVCNYDGKSFTSIPIFGANANFFITGQTSASSQTAVWSMLQDRTGKIWFGTSDDGVYRYDGKSFTHFLHNDSVINKSGLRLDAVNSIIEDKVGNIWFATWFEGVCRYDGKSITSFKPNDEVWYSALLEDKKGNIWIGRRGKGLCRYDGKTFTNVLQNGTLDSCGAGAMAEDKWGNIWLGTEHGNMTKREAMGGVWR
ncbi:MAG: hypothetical protein H0V61_02860, partial [Chitinophagales bacterium]|nr:hypothetical protein [Chitinophagales bacterium]